MNTGVLESLAVASFASFAVLSWLAYLRTRHVGVLMLAGLLYLYTFHGFVISLLANAGILTNVGPMFLGGSPYDVAINDDFWLAIVMQGIFANAYLLTLTFLAPIRVADTAVERSVATFRPVPLVAAGGLCLVAGTLMWFQALLAAIRNQQSLYLFFKEGGDLGVWYPVSRVFFDAASMSIGGAIGIVLSQFPASTARRRDVATLVVAALIGGALAVTMGLLGDRATLLGGFTFAVIIASRRRVRLARLAMVGTVALLALEVIAWVREGRSMFDPNGPSLLASTVNGLLVTAEASITFSMYATIRFAVPTSGGLSVLFFLETLVPRFIRPERTVPDAFEYYANAVGLPPLRGWGMHYATDAYINFGVIGLVIGAAVLAGLHGYFLRRLRRTPELLFPFAGCLASFPIGFRAGLPGLKTMAMGIATGYLLGLLARPATWTESPLRRWLLGVRGATGSPSLG